VSYLEEAAGNTPDPIRSLKNLESFFNAHPDHEGTLRSNIQNVAMLFAYSQFLANFSIKKPQSLISQIETASTVVSRQALAEDLRQRIETLSVDEAMRVFREFRREIQTGITLRDILRLTDTTESMEELSDLADSIVQVAADYIILRMIEKHGEPTEHSLAVFGLGKLGAQELNYSSDIDLIFIYGTDEGQTTGVPGPTGASVGSISNHEFYCKVATEFSKLLSKTTADGFVYRVDLRLRPNGERGDAALSLRSYEAYYESWGSEWERLALIRARHVAGDETLAEDFLNMIVPFVWRKYLDFSTIDEIRGLKARIDAKFKKDDIKRGVGGIREIEFFIQAFQLIYAGKEPLLRKRKTLIALYLLQQKNFIGDEDQAVLSENYLYFRRIEHYIQMLNDIQTHAIPSDAMVQESLARKTGFHSFDEFILDLKERRQKVHEVYNLFFRSKVIEEDHAETHFVFEEKVDDSGLERFLRAKNIHDIGSAARSIHNIREGVLGFHSLKGRKILRDIAPGLLDRVMASTAPDRSLRNFEHFLEVVSLNEAYLESFHANSKLGEAIIDVFSYSEYLSRLILSNPAYLDMLTGGTRRKKTLRAMREELAGSEMSYAGVNNAIRFFRKSEEIRLGLLFISRSLTVMELMSGLSKAAETIVDFTIRRVGIEIGLRSDEKVGIIAMGKLGGREIIIGSDLDIIFFTDNEVDAQQIRASERFLKILQAYTHEGIAYKVDTRLRPDGSKGPLMKSIEGYRDYYLRHAGSWEIQALLKARPVSGSEKAMSSFMKMRHEVFVERASSVKGEEIVEMRNRIMNERGKRGKGIDIKIDKGGLGEIEFLVQYLQLRHVSDLADYQSTVAALKQIRKKAIIPAAQAEFLEETYTFYRSIEAYMRLAMMQGIREEDRETEYLAVFMGYEEGRQFLQALQERFDQISRMAEMIYVR